MSLFDTGIRPAVDQWLLDESKKTRDYGKYWSASQAGYCMRKVIFERLGVPHISKDDDARKQRVFTAGHIFHDWIQGITKDAGLSIAQELELQDESLMIRGHIDDLVLVGAHVGIDYVIEIGKPSEILETPRLILYDYKTAHSKSFTYAKGRPMSYYHKMQLGTYMYMLRKVGLPTTKETDVNLRLTASSYTTPDSWKIDKTNLTEARILSISKDDLRMDEKQLIWSDSLEYEVELYWKTLNKAWNRKLIPKCTCDKHEGGFMAKEKWNPYWFDGEPCSLKYYEEWKLKELEE